MTLGKQQTVNSDQYSVNSKVHVIKLSELFFFSLQVYFNSSKAGTAAPGILKGSEGVRGRKRA